METFKEYLLESKKRFSPKQLKQAKAYIDGFDDGESRQSPAPPQGADLAKLYSLGHKDGQRGNRFWGASAPTLSPELLDAAM